MEIDLLEQDAIKIPNQNYALISVFKQKNERYAVKILEIFKNVDQAKEWITKHKQETDVLLVELYKWIPIPAKEEFYDIKQQDKELNKLIEGYLKEKEEKKKEFEKRKESLIENEMKDEELYDDEIKESEDMNYSDEKNVIVSVISTKTSDINAIKIKGMFEKEEQAKEWCEKLDKTEFLFEFGIVNKNEYFEVPVDYTKINNQVFQNSMLNDIINGNVKEKQKAREFYEEKKMQELLDSQNKITELDDQDEVDMIKDLVNNSNKSWADITEEESI